ncbi:MAG: lipooligosaccharide transport system ATP-binding protein [Actinomycetota bacterium]|jgi:lipooligosaccharide transport system ATP-binding protein|nr:lipooligosaccharide transport system ATP-binding protein [Actinomycetota bacterium]
MQSIVRAAGLIKWYADSPTPAVDGIDFEVEERECFGFLGPNGAGKTTTMRMVSCRARRSEGVLEVMGMDPSRDQRTIKEHIGVVPQETNLDTVIRVGENLFAHARYFGIPKPEARARAEEVLRFVQLDDRIEWDVEHLSGGMKRRLLIARALINRPRMLILDEPTTGLDPQARHLVWDRLRELKRQGVTLVLTTHYMEEAAQLCDRLVVMHQGKILVEGTPRALIRDLVAPQVVELTATDQPELAQLVSAMATRAEAHEVAGDRLILHVDDGEAMLKAVNDSGLGYETAAFRPASLEDVFLKLTGRTLEE